MYVHRLSFIILLTTIAYSNSVFICNANETNYINSFLLRSCCIFSFIYLVWIFFSHSHTDYFVEPIFFCDLIGNSIGSTRFLLLRGFITCFLFYFFHISIIENSFMSSFHTKSEISISCLNLHQRYSNRY